MDVYMPDINSSALTYVVTDNLNQPGLGLISWTSVTSPTRTRRRKHHHKKYMRLYRNRFTSWAAFWEWFLFYVRRLQ